MLGYAARRLRMICLLDTIQATSLPNAIRLVKDLLGSGECRGYYSLCEHGTDYFATEYTE